MNLDRWLSSASAAQTAADTRQADHRRAEWVVCAIAATVVGKYGRGLTRRIAENIGRSPDTVEHMAAAYAIYASLRARDARRAREARRKYGYLRFFELGVKWTRYEFDTADAFEYLESGLSTAAMGAQIEDVHNPVPEWRRRFFGTSRAVLKLVDDDAPEEVRGWARLGAELFRKFAKEAE